MSAIKAKTAGHQKVVLVEKGYIGKSGSSVFAAGVMNICTPHDDAALWLKEIVVRGEYLNDQEWVKTLLQETFPLATEMDGWGSKILGKPLLRRSSDGELVRIRGRGMESNRVCMVNSSDMMETMAKMTKTAGGRGGQSCHGDGYPRQSGAGYPERWASIIAIIEILLFLSKAVILAASGCGFKSFFLGHKNLTGEAQRTAYENGVILTAVGIFQKR